MAYEQLPEMSRRELLVKFAVGAGVLALTPQKVEIANAMVIPEADNEVERINYLKQHHHSAWDMLRSDPYFVAHASDVETPSFELLPDEYEGFNTEPIPIAMSIMTSELGLKRQTAAWWCGNFMGESADFRAHMRPATGGKLAINPWSGFIGGGPKGIAQWLGSRVNHLPVPERPADNIVDASDLGLALRPQLYYMFGEDLPLVVTGAAYDRSLDPGLTLAGFRGLAKDFEGYGAAGNRFSFADFIEKHTYTKEPPSDLVPLTGVY